MARGSKARRNNNGVGGLGMLLMSALVLVVTIAIFWGISSKLNSGEETPEIVDTPIDTQPAITQPELPDELSDDRNARVYFINVGQGDCELIVADDGSAMLIDCGESEYGKGVVSFIKDLGIDRLDYVVGTHPHSDHIGGLRHILKSDLEVGKVITPVIPDEFMPTTSNYEKFIDALAKKGCEVSDVKNESFDLGSGKITVMKPDYAADNYNNYCPFIMFEFGETSFLFTGDAEKLIEYQMVNRDEFLDADVLKVGHHGSMTSSCVDFLDEVTPDWCIIECGDNGYNHPNPNIVERLQNYTENILRTDKQGTILFTCDMSDFNVTTEAESDEKTDY